MNTLGTVLVILVAQLDEAGRDLELRAKDEVLDGVCLVESCPCVSGHVLEVLDGAHVVLGLQRDEGVPQVLGRVLLGRAKQNVQLVPDLKRKRNKKVFLFFSSF